MALGYAFQAFQAEYFPFCRNTDVVRERVKNESARHLCSPKYSQMVLRKADASPFLSQRQPKRSIQAKLNTTCGNARLKQQELLCREC